MTQPTQEQIQKLPKWAQEYIRNLERQRESAINTLNSQVDDQTPSPFYYEDWICTGERAGPSTKRRYVQSHRLHVEHIGIHLSVLLTDSAIDLQWERPNHMMSQVAMVPRSFNNVTLELPEQYSQEGGRILREKK